MSKIRVLVLDFDNCIILDEKTRTGSEEIKDEAWFNVFPEIERVELEPVLEKIKKEIAGGKGDRRDIALRVCNHFNISTAIFGIELRCMAFNEFVQNGIKKIGVSERTREAISALSKKIPLYINSATPASAVMESIKALDFQTYFRGVYGHPETKVENLRNIVELEGIAASELLFVGDQESDLVAAVKVDCQFVGMHTARNKTWHNIPHPFPLIFSLAELIPIVTNDR